MARFEGAAAKADGHLHLVASLLERGDLRLTAHERKISAEMIEAGIKWQRAMTKFLGDAPADAILRCGCAGCEHIKDNLSTLRGMAHRSAPTPGPTEAELKAGYW